MARWVYFTVDGRISHRCQYQDAVKDSPGFGTIDLADDLRVNPDTMRVDRGVVRALTVEELAVREQEREQIAARSLARQVAALTARVDALEQGGVGPGR